MEFIALLSTWETWETPFYTGLIIGGIIGTIGGVIGTYLGIKSRLNQMFDDYNKRKDL